MYSNKLEVNVQYFPVTYALLFDIFWTEFQTVIYKLFKAHQSIRIARN